MLVLYGILLTALGIYSYALVDPNITFFNNGAWTAFRNLMVQLGYYQRIPSTIIYIVCVALLFVFHLYFMRRAGRVSAIKIAIVAGALGLLAYPFLSHDIYNYIFDARIFTYYHQNPYTHTALDFPTDQMTRFMHWTHRNYPYGPSFLAITIIPSFLSLGKFILNYVLFKALMIGSYILAVYYLSKWKKEWAVFYATHPLVIVDGLINAHNDILAVSMALIGLYYVFHKSDVKGRIILLISGLIKYTTLPLVIAKPQKDHLYTKIAFGGIALVMTYLTFGRTVQPWYFLIPLTLIPYFYEEIKKYSIFYTGVLLSYCWFIANGVWSDPFMYSMILIPLAVNVIYNTSHGFRKTRLKKK